MKRFFKLTLIIGITMIALAISNIAYADDDFDILTPTDLPTESTSTTAPTTTTTTTPSTSTTLEIPKTTTTTVKITKTTNTSTQFNYKKKIQNTKPNIYRHTLIS